MFQFIGMTGKIQHIDDCGDLMISFMSNAMFHVNREVVTKASKWTFPAKIEAVMMIFIACR